MLFCKKSINICTVLLTGCEISISYLTALIKHSAVTYSLAVCFNILTLLIYYCSIDVVSVTNPRMVATQYIALLVLTVIVILFTSCPWLDMKKLDYRDCEKVLKQGEDSETLWFYYIWDPYFDCCLFWSASYMTDCSQNMYLKITKFHYLHFVFTIPILPF